MLTINTNLKTNILFISAVTYNFLSISSEIQIFRSFESKMFRHRAVSLITGRIYCAVNQRSLATATSVLPITFKPHHTVFSLPQHLLKPSTRSYCAVDQQATKKKKQKKGKTAVEHVGRLDIRIGKIIDVSKAPEAESLYLTKVDVGDEVRSIVAGLANFIAADDLLGKNVVVLCNLKPAKLRGHVSEGMIFCASGGDRLELLVPPANATPGDVVYCEGYERDPVETPRDKKKLYDPLADDMRTNGNLVACYKEAALYIPDKGNIVAGSFKNAPIQ